LGLAFALRLDKVRGHMRILLTGATGFVGSHVARALVAAGHHVRALARPTSSRALLDDVPELEWVTGDVMDSPSLTAAVRDREAVVHTAAVVGFSLRAAERQRAINVEGTRRLLDAAKAAGVQRFVHTSSVSAVGKTPEGTINDETARYDWPPGMAYNETKRDSERLVQKTAKDMTTICLSPALVFGPGDVFKRTLGLFRLVKWGLLPVVPPGGTTICDVRDVAEAHVSALTAGETGQRYILGGPHLTFRELATTVAEVTGGARPLASLPASVVHAVELPLAAIGRVLPLPVGVGTLEYLTNFGFYSSAKAEGALGYRTRPAAETLADSARWYGAQGVL
jgi:dihydroflavonol-4-reductase